MVKGTHYEKVVCACCFLFLCVNIGFTSTSFNVYQPYIVAVDGIGDTGGSLILAFRTLISLLCMLAVAKWYRLLDCRLGVFLASCLTAIGFFFYSLADHFFMFCLGGLFGSAFSGATPYTVAITAFFLAAILAAASNLLLTDYDYRTSWGTIRPSAEHDSIAIFYGSLPATCDAISQQYGLTPREEEVLILLAQRKSVADIEAELFISNPTAKTHVRNIYRKLGIHKRAELLAMVGHPSTASAASASTDGD